MTNKKNESIDYRTQIMYKLKYSYKNKIFYIIQESSYANVEMNSQMHNLPLLSSIPNLHKVQTSMLQKCTRYFYRFCII